MKPTHIVVVQAGWVFIGTRTVTDKLVTLTDASCVRKWGTTRGLGQLALSGPTTETELDPCGTTEIPASAVLFSLVVDQTKWP
jgi:hypothetical protein